MRTPLLGAALAGLVVVATGCSGSGQAATTGPTASTSASASPTATPTTAVPSVPPGDPGPDAPSVPDPGAAGATDGPAAPALRTVPAAALLGTTDVAQMLGGSWVTGVADPTSCLQVPGSVASRTSFASSGRATLFEDVSTHRSPAAADRAVADLERTLPDCGWDLGADPRTGTASLTATSHGKRLTVVSADGVTVLLLGAGGIDEFAWQGVVDMAMGTSCEASAEGCH